MSSDQVRSRRIAVRGAGPLVGALARVLGAEPDGPVDSTSDVVIVLDGGTFAPVPPGRVAQCQADTYTEVDAIVAELAPYAGDVRVIVVSSAVTLGAHPDPTPLTDDAEVDGRLEGTALLLAMVEEHVSAGLAAARLHFAMLRSAPLVGPGVDTMITRHFEAPRLLAVRGHARAWQFVHVDDVASAVGVMLEHGLTSDHVVGAPGALPLAQVLAAAGMRAVELPEATALSVAERLHRAGVLPAPAADLAYVVHDWTVHPGGLLAAGWVPAWSNEECLGVVLDDVRGRLGVAGRRVGGRDAAAVGAVGAAVALLGTAAVRRQLRRR